MKIEYYEEMLEEEALNKYLNMIANDYNGELARIFEEKYINKDKEIERLNNIIKRLEEDLREMYLTFGEFSEEYAEKKIKELKGSE